MTDEEAVRIAELSARAADAMFKVMTMMGMDEHEQYIALLGAAWTQRQFLMQAGQQPIVDELEARHHETLRCLMRGEYGRG